MKGGVVAPGFCSFVISGRNKHRGDHGMRSTTPLGERSDDEDILFKPPLTPSSQNITLLSPSFFSEEGAIFMARFSVSDCFRRVMCVCVCFNDR